MKTKVEINGYEIEIEERDGLISVTATFEDEVVEEFQIETEGQGGEESEEGQEDIQGFDEFGQEEEEDFGQEEDEDEDEFGQEDEEDGDEAQGALESFQSFINKKK
jgi:hypothetical protein